MGRLAEIEAQALGGAGIGVYGSREALAALLGLDSVRSGFEKDWARERAGSHGLVVDQDLRSFAVHSDEQRSHALFGLRKGAPDSLQRFCAELRRKVSNREVEVLRGVAR